MKTCISATLLAGAAAQAAQDGGENAQVIWLDKPAKSWEGEAFPLGNGRLGCMVFGGVAREHIQFNEDSLWTGDENPSGDYGTMGAYQNFGDLFIELESLVVQASPPAPPLAATPARATVECPSGHKSFYEHESIEHSVDGDPGTKWCVEHGGKPVLWRAVLPAGKEVAVKSYSFTSAADAPTRDPKEWTLSASNDAQEWVVLDKRSDEPIFERRQQKRTYNFENAKPYRFYQFAFTRNHGEARYQFGEIELAGVAFAGAQASAGGGARATSPADTAAEGYRRELDLAHAVCRVQYTLNGTAYRRETWCTHPDQVIVARLTAGKPGQYTGTISLKDGHGAATTAAGARLASAGALKNGLLYEAQLLVKNDGGEVKSDNGVLRFQNCDALTILLAARTNYVMDYARKWRGEDPHAAVTAELDAAAAKGLDELLKRHVADHQAFFNRVTLDVGQTPAERAALPMDRRLKSYEQDAQDPGLEALLFQYGRYLLIGCSRPGTLPANLQGLWNDRNNPPWSSDYHSNINIQMNYWLAEPCNLAECHEPFVALFEAIREPSRAASRAAFGQVRGFTLRTSHNIYGGLGWKWNLPASAWYCQHVWEHYAFGGDQEYLRKTAYPLLKEVSQFWEDHLKALPDGTLVAPKGWSPEHGPEEDGVAHDQQIIWDLFSNTVAASDALGEDREYRDHLAKLRDRLLGPKIGRWGQLQEWVADRDDPKDQHRHTSHLFAVYPGKQISMTKTPDFAKAAKISLEARGESGDSRRSWTWPWRCAMWARFREGEKAHHMIEGLLKYNTLPNLLANHPPMQRSSHASKVSAAHVTSSINCQSFANAACSNATIHWSCISWYVMPSDAASNTQWREKTFGHSRSRPLSRARCSRPRWAARRLLIGDR
ncbi:MAG: glycoside hydrolase N-terminal domain-containing protein [Planctomycetota bacterium]